MRRQLILSDNWFVRQLDDGPLDVVALTRYAGRGPDWLSARMPAQVHDVLLAHGRIRDPHVGHNAAECVWVAQSDWAYACRFVAPEGIEGPALLHFKGLDTLCTAYLNGARLGAFDNQFREWVVDTAGQLAPPNQENVLLLHFASPLRAIDAIEQPAAHVGVVARHKYLRKSLQDFGSYLGVRPHLAKIGVFDDVVLDLPEPAWLDDVWVRVDLEPGHERATLWVQVESQGTGPESALHWSLADPAGNVVARGEGDPIQGAFEVHVRDPLLWWPHTHGRPNLYTLAVELVQEGVTLDRREVTVGMREVQFLDHDIDTGDARFQFTVNGRPIWLQGAGLAPFEGLTHCWRPERAQRLIELAERAGMNLLRVWGDGDMPADAFYDACDRQGILVWQDFMFGYGMYPDHDPAFLENVRAEVEGTVRRLRNHACILLWVGGNENYMGYDFASGGTPSVGRHIFEEIMPEVCERLDPTRMFHPNSPYGGRVPNWPLEGDWHDGDEYIATTVAFSHHASVPLFASEIGRVSAPAVHNLRRFMDDVATWPPGHDPAVRVPGAPSWPLEWSYHAADGAWEKIGPIERFPDPSGPADLVRALGTAHGEYLRDRIERQRRGVPDGSAERGRRCWGNMVWRLNDAWPTIYSSVTDYYLEPKIAYYYLRRAYAPVLLSFEHTLEDLNVWVINDSDEPVRGRLRVRRMRFDGATQGEAVAEVQVGPGESLRALSTDALGPISLRHEFLEARLGALQATYLLIGERYLALPRARLGAAAVAAGIEVATDAYARQVSLAMEGVSGAVFEDDYFDLPPHGRRTVAVIDPAGGHSVVVSCVNGETLHVAL
jgi:beta-mannosidase